jgi:hypothetical protein
MMKVLNKKYPDTLEGAIKCLKKMSRLNTKGATGIPDPYVQGVWKIYCHKEKFIEDRINIVYLSGYETPLGHIRTSNDFETVG